MSVIQNHRLGIFLITLSMLYLPGLDVFGKLLGENGMSAGQIAISRFVFQALVLAPIVLILGVWSLDRRLFAIQMLRGACMAIASLFFFAALKYMPLADSISIFFVEPMIVTLLSVFILGERIYFRRIFAIITGFIGALLIVQPNFLMVGPAALLPLGTAFFFAIYFILTRFLSADVHPFWMQLNVAVAAIPTMGLGVLLFPQSEWFILRMPVAIEWGWIVAMGVIATSGHLLLVYAMQRAPANLLTPFQYVEIIGAVMFGYLVFGDLPTIQTIAGIVIIVASGLYIFHRENKQAS
ncbi:MAG: DMT family transporter [Candidatus Puniceispirillaceae bacterium]